MKNIVLFIATFALIFTVFTANCQAETKVYSISAIKDSMPDNAVYWQAYNTVLKIVDTDNNIVCYAVASSSTGGRRLEGGYPMNSITCIRVEKAK
jgi:hypothetical protein